MAGPMLRMIPEWIKWQYPWNAPSSSSWCGWVNSGMTTCRLLRTLPASSESMNPLSLIARLLTTHPAIRRLGYGCITCSCLATSKDAVLVVFIPLSRTSLWQQRLRRLATYPIGYPFQVMLEFIVDCKDVVKLFHNHCVSKAQLLELQKTINAQAQVCPAPTCWVTIQQRCQCLLDSESHLHAISSARDFIKGTVVQQVEDQKVQDIITRNQLVVKLKRALMILVPLDRLIFKYQSDKIPISEVIMDFHALLKEFKMLLDSHITTRSGFEYLVSIAHSRLLCMYAMVHVLWYLLDPFLLGECLPPGSHHDLETALYKTPVNNMTPSSDETNEIIYMQYMNFFFTATREKTADRFCNKMLKKGNKSVLQYYLVNRKS